VWAIVQQKDRQGDRWGIIRIDSISKWMLFFRFCICCCCSISCCSKLLLAFLCFLLFQLLSDVMLLLFCCRCALLLVILVVTSRQHHSNLRFKALFVVSRVLAAVVRSPPPPCPNSCLTSFFSWEEQDLPLVQQGACRTAGPCYCCQSLFSLASPTHAYCCCCLFHTATGRQLPSPILSPFPNERTATPRPSLSGG